MLFSGFDEAVVIDLETTGLDPGRDRVVSIAMIRSRFADLKRNSDMVEAKTMDALVHPKRRILPEASRVNGITDLDVADKPPFAEIAPILRDFIGERPIIAHNVSFDRKFLNAEFRRAGVKTLARNRSFCTMRKFEELSPGRKKSLDDVADWMGVKGRTGPMHGAIEDARIAWQIAARFYMMEHGINATIIDGDILFPASVSLSSIKNVNRASMIWTIER